MGSSTITPVLLCWNFIGALAGALFWKASGTLGRGKSSLEVAPAIPEIFPAPLSPIAGPVGDMACVPQAKRREGDPRRRLCRIPAMVRGEGSI
jgi:hypothetical protein